MEINRQLTQQQSSSVYSYQPSLQLSSKYKHQKTAHIKLIDNHNYGKRKPHGNFQLTSQNGISLKDYFKINDHPSSIGKKLNESVDLGFNNSNISGIFQSKRMSYESETPASNLILQQNQLVVSSIFQRKRNSLNERYKQANQYEEMRSSNIPTAISIDLPNGGFHNLVASSTNKKPKVQQSYFGNIDSVTSIQRKLKIDKQLLQELEYQFAKQLPKTQISNTPKHGNPLTKEDTPKSQFSPPKNNQINLLPMETLNNELFKRRNSLEPVLPLSTPKNMSAGSNNPTFLSNVIFGDISQLRMKSEKDEHTRIQSKQFKQKFRVLREAILQEVSLNQKLFELKASQTLREPTNKEIQSFLEGTQVLIYEQFQEFLNFDIKKIQQGSSPIQDQVDQFSQLTKNYRYLIRVLKILTQSLDSNEQFQILKAYSFFWKSVSMNIEYILQNRQISLDKQEEEISNRLAQKYKTLSTQYEDLKVEHTKVKIGFQTMKSEFQSTIEKLTNDKQQLQDNLIDREDELKRIMDPRQFNDLKKTVNEMDYNMQICESQKQTQYDEMRRLLVIMSDYKDQYDIQQAKKSKGVKLLRKISRKKIDKTTSIVMNQQAQKPNIILMQQKRHQTSPIGDLHYFATVTERSEEGSIISDFKLQDKAKNENEDEIKNILMQLMNNNNDGDLQIEFKNQKEALTRKEKLLAELNNLIRQLQDLRDEDPHYQHMMGQIEMIYGGLNSINNGIMQGCQMVSGDKVIAQTQTDPCFFQQDDDQANQDLMNDLEINSKAKQPKMKASQNLIRFQKGGSENKQVNPLVKAIGNLLQISTNKIQFDPKIKISEATILKIMEGTMEDKGKMDIDNEKTQEIDQRKFQSFPGFLYDSILMQHGLKSIAVKNVLQLCSGLKQQSQFPYANYLARVVGIVTPSLEKDQSNVFLRAYLFFKDIQSQWIKRESDKCNHQPSQSNILATLKMPDDQVSNLQSGGECGICEIIDEIRQAFDRETYERICSNLKPEQLKKVDKNNQALIKKFNLEFSLVKIIYKISKIGKDIKYIYDILDQDKSGSLEKDELIIGLRQQFGIYLSDSEANELVAFLDTDNSGDINFQEFLSKINYKDLSQKINIFTITKISFIETILNEWCNQKVKDKSKVIEIFHKFDDNGDGVLVFDEFETLLKSLEPNLKKKQIVNLFREALDGNDQADDALNDESFAQMIMDNKIGGIGKEFFTDYLYEKVSTNLLMKQGTRKNIR